MKKSIPRYTFYKEKYGSKLLVDVVELKHIKRFLTKSRVHTLTYYDITFITEGEGTFSINNKAYPAKPCDTFFSQPGEIRSWDTDHIKNGYALIFEDEFLSLLLKDSLFIQHLSFFRNEEQTAKLTLSDELYNRILQILHYIKSEINSHKQYGTQVLRALLYEILMLLDRTYLQTLPTECKNKGLKNNHVTKFIELVGLHLQDQRAVGFYADKLCITPNYLNEIISAAMGISAKQYIQNKVMEEAEKQLIYTDSSISDIAFNLHFSTVSHFTRFFRQHSGKTPLCYRKSHKP